MLFFIFGGLLCFLCMSNEVDEAVDFNFRDGDVVFVRGKSFRSIFIRLVRAVHIVLRVRAVPDDYSHVGIIKIVGGRAYVVHASPRTRKIQSEPVDVFLAPSDVDLASVYRFNGDSLMAAKASLVAWNYYTAGVPFDDEFNIFSDDRIYCTELVWLAWKNAGVDIFGDNPGKFLFDSKVYGKVLLPAELSKSIYFKKAADIMGNF